MQQWQRIHELNKTLLKNLKENLPALKELKEKVEQEYAYIDAVYRYYHFSFKVYYIQDYTFQIVEALMKCAPKEEPNEAYEPWEIKMNQDFQTIYNEGTGKKHNSNHNKDWDKHTRPMLEAFFHAKYFLDMAVKYAEAIDEAPMSLPYGWAGLLYFYNLR